MKFNLNQTIFYIRNNKMHSAPIVARMCVDNLHQDWASTKEQKQIWTPFGDARVMYATCHGLVSEAEAFASKEDLLKAIGNG